MLLVVPGVFAFWGGGPQNDTNELLAQLFGKTTAFTATGNVAVKGRTGREKNGAELQYSFLDGKMLVGVDVTKTKKGAKLANEMSVVAGMGMGEIIVLIRPDKKAAYTILPGAKSYCEHKPTVATHDNAKPKIERTELGREEIDGHPCVKSKVVITDANGKSSTVIAWAATDMNEFPLKSEMESDGDTVVTTFKNVKFEKPAAALFELPENFARYESVQDMMMQSMQRMMQGGRE